MKQTGEEPKPEVCPNARVCRLMDVLYMLAEEPNPCGCLKLYHELKRRTGWRGWMRRVRRVFRRGRCDEAA